MNSIPADVWRGGEKWMVNAASGLRERGHTVLCIGRTKAVWLEAAATRGLQTHGLPIHADFDPVIIWKLYRLFRELNIEILCCNFEKDVRLGGIAARCAGVPSVVVRKGLSLIYDKLRYRLAYRYIVDDIITPAHFIKKQFSQFRWLSEDRIHVVHNGVEVPPCKTFSKVKLSQEIGHKDELCILGAGSLFSQKGFEYLIEAVSMVHKGGGRVHLVIAGAGDQEPYAELARKLQIGEYVHFLGHRSDLRELMYGADIFVLSSIDEGLPNVVLEAMSAGTAVVAAEAGGTAEIITDGVDGFVVPTKSASALAEKIGFLIENEAVRKKIGDAARATAVKRFSIEVMVDAVEKLFQEQIEKGSGKGRSRK